MANVHVTTKPLIAKAAPYPATVGNAPVALRSAKRSVPPQVSGALEATATALTNIQGSLNTLHSTLRQNTPSVEQVYVTDKTGKVIAALGDFSYQGVITPNYFSEIHVGDPLGTGNPALALFNAANGVVSIGQNGIVEVLDPFGNAAAWIGTQADTMPVTNAVDNGSGLIRLTVTAHTLATGDTPTVMNVGGVPNATGIFTVTVIDANTIDLQNSVFVGTYTSGGTVNRILHITGATNNGGLIRIQTGVAHGYTTGDETNVVAVGGVPAATGQWIVTVVDSLHFDLQGSTFAGAYTSGGTCLRYFAGMLAQTIAIGPSFPNYKLRAFADGSLRISDAEIVLTGSSATVTLDPATGSIIVDNSGTGNIVTISNGITLSASNQSAFIYPGEAQFTWDVANTYYVGLASGLPGLIVVGPSGATWDTSQLAQLTAYTGTHTFGPLVSCIQGRGTGAAPSGTLSGDTLGGIVMASYTDNPYAAGVRAVATENHSSGTQGAKVVIEVTKNGGFFAVINAATFDQSGYTGLGGNTAPAYPLDVTGDINTSGVYRVAGTQVVTSRQSAISAPSISTSNTAATASATYTATEQGMLNALKTAVGSLNTDVGNLATVVNNIRSTFTAHGLTS